MLSRRNFISLTGRLGLAGATMPLWSNQLSMNAFGQSTSQYKAIVLITLIGGNDGNNMLIPTGASEYAAYAAMRPAIALPKGSCIPLTAASGAATYGLHPNLPNVAKFYNNGQALFVANVGPLGAPVTKTQLLANSLLEPQSLMSHPVGQAQWESAQTITSPQTGWGGRIADFLASQSGSLPPVLNAGEASIFTVGRSVQAVVLQASNSQIVALPAGINTAIQEIASADANSTNQIIQQTAELRLKATQEQQLLLQAQSFNAPLTTTFPTSGIGNSLAAVAKTINGRSALGASRQIFYCNQEGYDTHGAQLALHGACLSDLDKALAAFMAAMQEMGLENQVLVCTHTDFNRTMQANTAAGTDHAWGNHQIILGGGIRGGRILGTMPDLELGGTSDLTTQGIWIPTTSVTQMTAGIGSWMGLTASQLTSVFPDLVHFGNLPLQLT